MSHGSSWKLRHGKVVVVSLVSLVLGRRERLGEVCGDGERLQQDSQIKSSMTSWADQDGSISYVCWIRWKPGTRSGGIGSTAWTNGLFFVWGSFQSFNVILRISEIPCRFLKFCHSDFSPGFKPWSQFGWVACLKFSEGTFCNNERWDVWC